MKQSCSARRSHWLRAAVALTAVLLLGAGIRSGHAQPLTDAVPASAITRTLEPVILTGDQFSQFNGAPLHDLFVYAFNGSAWSQVPFQFDEVDADGAYGPEGGTLDANDELVFMAKDLGQQATTSQWIGDSDAQNNPRYEVQVTNPLASSEQGWVYVYRSSSLSTSASDYVTWDGANNRVVAGTYVAGWKPSVLLLKDSLQLNGTGVDILDREKVRLRIKCYTSSGTVEQTATEEDAKDQYVAPDIDGLVRVGGGSTSVAEWYYASFWQAESVQDFNNMQNPNCTKIEVLWIRQSTDWLDPASTGMAPMTYYDSNTSGVAIDGSPDSIDSTPLTTWRQVSGKLGSLVQVEDVAIGTGTSTNYYRDDEVPDTNDPGDNKSYGDAGFRLDNPTGLFTVARATYVLGANAGNVGNTYRSYNRNPLTPATAAQTYVPPCTPPSGADLTWSPSRVEQGVATTFTASLAEGTSPLTYAWNFSDDGSTPSGNPVSHTFAQAGTYSVQVTISNKCGQTTVTKSVDVVCDVLTNTAFDWQPATPGPGETVTFDAQANGTAPISFAWDFGDGATGSGASVTHAYNDAGSYTVELKATNPCGDQLLSKSISIVCREVTGLDMSWQPQNPEIQQSVSFSAQTTGGMTPITFAWDFGDGSTGSGASPTHTYSQAGSYTVKVTASNICGDKVLTKTITVTCREVTGLDMSWQPQTPEIQQSVSFSAQTTGGMTPITFAWDFGDGSTGSGANPTHTYSQAGTYSVKVTATNPCGDKVLTKSIEVVCNAPTGTTFSWDPATPEENQLVTFSGQASGTAPITFAWDFGDGSTGSGASPTHTYQVTGTYTVALTADNPCGSQVASDTLTVVCAEAAGLSMSWEPQTPEIEQSVTFHAQTTEGVQPTSLTWDFGDGSTGSGTDPTHAYAHTGAYTVTLTGIYPCGRKVVPETIEVICREITGLDMSWQPENPEVQQSVSFSAQTTGGMTPITFAWDFGDGSTGSGSNPSHTYTQAGSYTVKVTATNPCGDKTLTRTINIGCDAVTGTAISWDPTSPTIQQVVTFSAQASGTAPITFTWDFGDGSSGNGASVTHAYAAAGTYTVVLGATNVCGSQSVSRQLTVACDVASGVDFTWTPSPPEIGQSVTFTGDAQGTAPISYTWTFGDDGSTATGKVVNHTFSRGGSFDVTLSATNKCGSAASRVHSVQVQWEGQTSAYLPTLFCEYTPPVPACSELILNGSFEDSSAWYLPNTPRPPRYTTERAHTGARSVLLGLKPGESDVEAWSSARQTITVPGNVEYVTLTFWYYPVSSLDGDDYQECLILDANDNVLARLMRVNSNEAAWLRRAFDLTAYADQTIKVYFNAYNDGDGPGVAAMYVDDVSVESCPPGVPPPPAPACYPALWGTALTGQTPHGIAVNSSAGLAYVANNGENTLSVINTKTSARVTTVAVGDGPNGVAYNSANNQIYVANSQANTVSVLRASDYGLVTTIAVGSSPDGVAVNASTNRVYVANFASDTVSIINGANNTVIQTVVVGDEPSMISVNPNTNKAYVALHGGGRVGVISGNNKMIQVDVYSAGPYGIAVDAQRNLVYVATIDTFRIAVVDGATDTYLGWAEIRRASDSAPVPMRQIAVNPSVGSSGHIYVTTVGEDGGWNKLLMLAKGWPDRFDRPVAMDLNEAREGIAFDSKRAEVLATSRTDGLLSVYLDGLPGCPYNFASEYKLTVCVVGVDGTCAQRLTR